MADKIKQIQIPISFVTNVQKLIIELENYQLDKSTQSIINELETQISIKIRAMDKHKTFTEYKSAEKGSTEREKKRTEYLEKAEINSNFQSSKEFSYSIK